MRNIGFVFFMAYLVFAGGLSAQPSKPAVASRVSPSWRNAELTPFRVRLIKGVIARVAREERLDVRLFLAVAECESRLNPAAAKVDSIESSHGVFQINRRVHRQVTEEQAHNVEDSARWAAPLFKIEPGKHWKNCYRQIARAQSVVAAD